MTEIRLKASGFAACRNKAVYRQFFLWSDYLKWCLHLEIVPEAAILFSLPSPHPEVSSSHLRQLYDKPEYCHGQDLKQNKMQQSYNKQRKGYFNTQSRSVLQPSPTASCVKTTEGTDGKLQGMSANEQPRVLLWRTGNSRVLFCFSGIRRGFTSHTNTGLPAAGTKAKKDSPNSTPPHPPQQK